MHRQTDREIYRRADSKCQLNPFVNLHLYCLLCPVDHPNIRMFITHGGLLSTQEAIHRGVPLLGIPIFGDQSLNMNRAVTAGYGIMIRFNNVTTESLLWAIGEMIDNPKYVR